MVVPPNPEQLREAVEWMDRIDFALNPREETARESARFLLSLAESGGRLVVETPCEHGVFHDSCDQLVCGHDHLLTDGWYPDARAECWCPGGSRMQVWPTDKETA